MNFAEELGNIARKLRNSFIAFIIAFFFVTFFDPINLKFGLTTSLSVSVFRYVSKTAGNIRLIAISPFEAVITDLKVGMILAFVITLPYILYSVLDFVFPGLTRKEKRMLKYSLIPSTLLFVIGVLFAWFMIIPLLFYFTNELDVAMGIMPTISANYFVSTILMIMIAMGISFELPVVISSLVFMGIVSTKTLASNWRYAVLGSFFIALLISPGATGGLMETLIGSVLFSLYGAGVLIGKLFERRFVYGKYEEYGE